MKPIENNRIIAEFMGLPSINDEGQVNFIKGLKHTPDYELQYHSNWNWLMPVVEEIYQLGLDNESALLVRDAVAEANLDSTYKAVVEFIMDR